MTPARKEELRKYFQNSKNKYFHDLLNDKFYDDIVFRKKDKGYYVEVGALDGWTHSQTIHFEHVKNWDGIIVEPSPQQLDKINENRGCNVCTNPISDVRETKQFVVRDFLAYSHLEDIDIEYGPTDVIEKIEVETITLVDLFDKYKSPEVIDFVSIDTEGYELRILEKYFEENTKYKINLISIEHSNEANVYTFFKDKPYVEIVNPYLNFIKASDIGTIRLDITDNNFYTAGGDKYEGDATDIKNIIWERYYVHLDFLRENVHLKDYIMYNANHQSNQIFN
jgi:FkbM family methyltransferase